MKKTRFQVTPRYSFQTGLFEIKDTETGKYGLLLLQGKSAQISPNMRQFREVLVPIAIANQPKTPVKVEKPVETQETAAAETEVRVKVVYAEREKTRKKNKRIIRGKRRIQRHEKVKKDGKSSARNTRK